MFPKVTNPNSKYVYVNATAEEVSAYQTKHGRGPTQYRLQCKSCGTRIWGSGLGVGAHNRACKGVTV